MADTLVIGGTTYNNVAGFKATDSNDNTQTFIRPTGTKSISITENGTITEDVAAYANAEISVNVSGGGSDLTIEGYEQKIQPSGDVVSTSPTIAGYGPYRSNHVMTSYKNLVIGNIGYPDNFFLDCSGLTSVVMPNFTNQYGNNVFNGCTNLEIVDFGGRRIGNADFNNCRKLKTIILRSTTYFTWLNAVSSFNGTPFANGGTGGTIYIPKQYYDQLGTGSSEDFKAATNWSTVDGYGTITWAQIEGSIYETQYADGTPVT